MVQKYNVASFYLSLFCLGITSYSLYSYINNKWLISPPNYILLLISIITFIYGLKGYEKEKKWSIKLRSWLTITISFALSIILALALFFSLLLSGFGANERIKTIHSPDGNYTIDFYRWDVGVAGTFGIRGELNGPLWIKKRVYFQKRIDYVEINWINNYTVSINERILNLREGETFGF